MVVGQEHKYGMGLLMNFGWFEKVRFSHEKWSY